MDKFGLLSELVGKVGEYADTTTIDQPISVENFAAWLTTTLIGDKTNPKTASLSGDVMDVTIGRYLAIMYRYSRQYSKSALENSPLLYDEFSYLVSLYSNGGMTKGDLIALNVQEMSTGSALIRRLMVNGYIVESPDPHDRRRQRVELTAYGTEILRGAFHSMAKVSSIVTGNLTVAEKRMLIIILQKLDTFHKMIGEKERNLDVDAILAKYF